MKVCLVCNNDWANTAYILEQCFKISGINAKAFTKHKHHYNYPNQAEIINKTNLKNYIRDSDIVVFVHSELVNTGIDLSNKKIYVMHTGSKYRQNSKEINKVFNPIVTATLSAGDVLGMGAKNEIWIQPPIDTELIKPVFKRSNKYKLVIGHYPSGKFKGTEKIKLVIDELSTKYNFYFIYDINTVSWNKQIERMSKCDIYIENMMEYQGEVPLKIFGMTSLEAGCLGKIPVMRFPLVNEYEKEFGKCGIQVANNLTELKEKLEWLLSLPKDQIYELQKQSRDWVEKCHSYKVIGKRYKDIFER